MKVRIQAEQDFPLCKGGREGDFLSREKQMNMKRGYDSYDR